MVEQEYYGFGLPRLGAINVDYNGSRAHACVQRVEPPMMTFGSPCLEEHGFDDMVMSFF